MTEQRQSVNDPRQRRNSKVPIRELPEAMPAYQHPVYPELYTMVSPESISYKWDCIILDLDRTIIHGKRLSVKRWRKYVENGTIPSLAEKQCSKWHRHIHRRGHQMHPFIRGRTMIYYRPFTWHLLAVLDYLKSHFGTKIIVCTKAGEHYAASVLAALISNFTSANPDLIDDVYNFHDLQEDEEEQGKPKKPFRAICDRHDVDPAKTLIVDDNATSWFDADRKITNFWMPPCYGYQIHDSDNELQLLCKYLWDPIQQNHLKKREMKNHENLKKNSPQKMEQQNVHKSQSIESSESSISPKRGHEIASRVSPKSMTSSSSMSPKKQHYLDSPQQKNGALSPTYSVISDQEDSHKSMPSISIPSISHSYNKRKYNEYEQSKTQSKSSPKAAASKTKKKYGFFESKSRGSKKLAKMIGK